MVVVVVVVAVVMVVVVAVMVMDRCGDWFHVCACPSFWVYMCT